VLYADDTSLVCNNVNELNELLKICTKFGLEYEIKFNASKTQYMIFNKNFKDSDQQRPNFNGENLEEVTEIKFLGSIIKNDLSTDAHSNKRIEAATHKMNCLKISGFKSNYASSELKMNQYKSYIRSTLLYDSENQIYNKKQLDELQSCESTIIKRAYGIPAKLTKSTDLNRANKLNNISSEIFKNKVNFLRRLLANNYTKELVVSQMSYTNTARNEESLIGHIMRTLNHYNNDLNWLLMRAKDKIEENNNKYHDEQNTFKCQRIKVAMKHKNKVRRNKIYKIVRMVQNGRDEFIHQTEEQIENYELNIFS